MVRPKPGRALNRFLVILEDGARTVAVETRKRKWQISGFQEIAESFSQKVPDWILHQRYSQIPLRQRDAPAYRGHCLRGPQAESSAIQQIGNLHYDLEGWPEKLLKSKSQLDSRKEDVLRLSCHGRGRSRTGSSPT